MSSPASVPTPGKKMRRHTPRVSALAAGLIASAVIGAACYLVFGGSLPFTGSPYVLKALFTSNTELHIPSPVRIAGVDVGEVVGVRRLPGSDAGVVTMDIDRDGLPIHADATVKIRSRIFLEGNFYVELYPGSPSARVLPSGSTLTAAATTGPVQLDRILSSLDQSARAHLQTLVRGLGSALDAPPTAAADATQDPSVRGLTGGQALNLSLRYSAQAFEASSIVNQALLGTRSHDLSAAVAGNARVLRALADAGSSLAGFVHTFNATMGTLASRQAQLSRTIGDLVPLLHATQTADTELDASFAPTRAFAAALVPSIARLDPTIGLALPWLAQATALASPQELGGLLDRLTPAVDRTAQTIGATRRLIHVADLLARCFSHTIVPTGNEVIADPPVGTGERVYQELFQSAVGIAGAAGNFDGNGRYVRASAGGGAIRAQTPPVKGSGPLYGNFVLAPLGTRPAWPTAAPPITRAVACDRNAPPDLNAAATGAGP